MKVLGHEDVAKLNGSPLRALKIPVISQPPMIIHPTRRITAEHASATEGQLPDSVYVEQMTNIEI